MIGGTGNMMPGPSQMPGQGAKYPNNALLQLLQKQLPGMGPISGGFQPPSDNPLARGSKFFRPPGSVPNAPGGSGNPAERPPGPGSTGGPPPPAQPAGGLSQPTIPGMQPGQYGTGRTGDGSQTQLMTPDVQAWINHMLHGPGLNTSWRQNLQMDPNNILQSIERASGQKYVPGGWQMPMPGVGY